MRISSFVGALAIGVAGVSVAYGQTVVVPETTYSALATVVPNSVAMLDADSAFMAFTDHAFNRARFQVVNIDTGVIELAPVSLPVGMWEASVAILASDAALIVVRDQNDPVPRQGHRGKYFVVNPLTGDIVRGPIPFASGGTSNWYRLAVVDASTVVIAYNNGSTGTFIVVDPGTASVKVPETVFVPLPMSTDGVEVAALDGNRVVIAYSVGFDQRMFFLVLDPHDGAIVRAPAPLGIGYPSTLIARNSTEVLLAYQSIGEPIQSARFVTFDTVTGIMGPSTTYVTGEFFGAPIAMFGGQSVFAGFSHVAGGNLPAAHAVFDAEGPQLLAPAPFNDGPTYHLAVVSSGCRILISYQDVPDGQKGKFQVLDFSDVCTPPPCPPEISDRIDLFPSPFVPFFVPSLQLQLVLARNRTAEPIAGPFSLLLDDLQNSVVIGARRTGCQSPKYIPFVRLAAGADNVLSPGEIGGAWLLFLKTAPDPISYRPRVLQGIPSR